MYERQDDLSRLVSHVLFDTVFYTRKSVIVSGSHTLYKQLNEYK